LAFFFVAFLAFFFVAFFLAAMARSWLGFCRGKAGLALPAVGTPPMAPELRSRQKIGTNELQIHRNLLESLEIAQ